MDIGRIALENAAYDDAEEIFQYVAKEYSDTRNYQYARTTTGWKRKNEKLKIPIPIDPLEIRELANQYQIRYIKNLNPYSNSLSKRLRSKALLHAFYLDEIDFAAQLSKSARKPILKCRNAQLISKSKLDLGDIYLLKGEPWEATLLVLTGRKSLQES